MEVQTLQQQMWFVTIKSWLKTIMDFVSFFIKIGGIIGFVVSMISLVLYASRINHEINIMNVNIKKEINSGFERIEAKFDHVDKRFDHIDRKFELADDRFNIIDRKFELVDKRFNQIDSENSIINKEISHMSNEISNLSNKIDKIDNEERISPKATNNKRWW
ncbi:hypothetical protein C1646_759161 [Rhizophagus diaphanus]|nr:hypothetical protein C1646_759161 [Rhizophagus diaphanus] [Rhizophagus sp. MUCL 43196]